MVLDVAALPEGTTNRDLTASPEELHLGKDACRFEEQVRIHLSAHKAQDEVVAQGEVSTGVTATCVRCLEDFPISVAESFRVVIRLVPNAEAGADAGDENFFLVPNNEPVWNSGDLFRELILLALPVNPLCREDCAGLCAGCGRNLNSEGCVCADKPADGPLGRLKGLLNGAGESDRV
ncbi:MAG TPA: DUF177 domain-containing protein [Acidobacteriota bacterium]|nr:DUF177 domain-containing protein [Acidobacteriota bacterium]